jgi:hypothetical protein
MYEGRQGTGLRRVGQEEADDLEVPRFGRIHGLHTEGSLPHGGKISGVDEGGNELRTEDAMNARSEIYVVGLLKILRGQ